MTKQTALPGHWALHDAKAHLGEVVRRAIEGPQTITVHGHEAVVVVSVEEYRSLQGDPTGEVLVKMMQNSPLGDIEFERDGTRSPVRRVKL